MKMISKGNPSQKINSHLIDISAINTKWLIRISIVCLNFALERRNLLLPIGGEKLPFRQRARYVFIVYRADGLPDMSSLCRKTDFENINPYVQISFAGMKVRKSSL